MRFATILCLALVICTAYAEDSTDNSNSTTTVEPPTSPPTTKGTTTPPPPPPTTLPPAPPTEPTPADAKYFVNDTSSGNVCILADFAAQILVTYENTANISQTATLNVVNATVDEKLSNCNENKSSLVLNFGANKLVLWFVHENKDKWVNQVDLTYTPNKEIFPGYPKIGPQQATFVNLTLFKVTDNQSYSCKADSATDDKKEVIINFSSVQVESFRNAKDQTFAQAQDCSAEKVSDLVPIAVGCALLALVLIVLIAYFIGRRRSRRLAYQSV